MLPAPQIFGPEPVRDWCYYYEKAELQAQAQNWDEVTAIFEQVEGSGLSSDQPIEYISFITGYMEQADWESAANLSIQAIKKDPSMGQQQICVLWSDFGKETGGEAAFQNALSEMQEQGACP